MQRPQSFPKKLAISKGISKKPWYIYYRFYDPRYLKGKLVVIKGMNQFNTQHERQQAIRMLMETELNQLKQLGYNPIAQTHASPVLTKTAILPETPLMEALHKAFEKGNYNGGTKNDIKGVLNYIGQAACLLQFEYLRINDFKTLHLLPLLEQCGRIKKRWTNNTYNVYLKFVDAVQLHSAIWCDGIQSCTKYQKEKNH